MHLNKNWNILPVDNQLVERLSQEAGWPQVVCRLLHVRGINTLDEVNAFFRHPISGLHNPYLMKGMDKAVERINTAFNRQEKIMVYGDYDVDGATSVALMYSFLKKQYPHQPSENYLSYYVPNRYYEGYGISFKGIDEAHSKGCTLIIALDCGIKAVDKVAYAKNLGIDFIICDHHLPEEELPEAVAILNPKQIDCPYPYKELSGCGIGYKLISALSEVWNVDAKETNALLDLVATSIAADIVPIDGENRILAYYGLRKANQKPCLALSVLKELSDLNRPFTISDLVFVVAPRINAAGRMDDARKAITFFIEENEEKSFALAKELQADNSERKEIDRVITEEALELLNIESQLNIEKYSTIVYQSHWHKGVIGIVASRLIDSYYRPTIVLTESQGKITGSARSVHGFNVYDAIHDCADLLENYGGHFFAAGLTLLPENLPAFIAQFESRVKSTITEDSRIPVIDIDAEISFEEITPDFYQMMCAFEPFGPKNLRPVFASYGVQNAKLQSRIVKDKHIRFVVKQGRNGQAWTGIGFNLAEKFDIVASEQPFDIVYTIEMNEWNGNKQLQLKVLDIRTSVQY